MRNENKNEKVKVSYTYGNVSLDETSFLNVDIMKETYDPKKMPTRKMAKKERVETKKFRLKKVTQKELIQYRKAGVPSFVMKLEGTLYHTEIPDDLNLMTANILGKHLCAMQNAECGRLSAARDEDGGCKKVRDKSIGIERYPWILTGFETFNTRRDVFVVAKCLHYEKYKPQNKYTPEQIKKAKISIAQYVLDDENITSLAQVRMRKRGLRENRYW